MQAWMPGTGAKNNRWNGEGFGHVEVLSGNPKIGATTTTTTTTTTAAATAATTTTTAALMSTATVTTTSMIVFNVWYQLVSPLMKVL